MLLGHLALPVLLEHYHGYEIEPLLLGSLFPDLVDKSLHQLGLTRTSRHIGHTLFMLTVTTLWVALGRNRQQAKSWSIGYLSHLLADGYWLPWLYPFRHYRFYAMDGNYARRLRQKEFSLSAADIVLSFWALGVLFASHRSEIT